MVSRYHRLPVAQKRAAALAEVREEAVRCPMCETKTPARDLRKHMDERCPGRPPPHAASAWVTFDQARTEHGVPRSTLSRWVRQDLVRVTGPVGDRRYLLRDLAVCVAAQRARQRR